MQGVVPEKQSYIQPVLFKQDFPVLVQERVAYIAVCSSNHGLIINLCVDMLW